jgi:hypothetical protein
LAALSLLAANLPKITDEPTPAVYPVATLAPDFAIPPSLAGIGEIDPLPLDHPCSPVDDANGITLEEVGHLLEVPGDGADLKDIDNLILLPDNSLFDLFRDFLSSLTNHFPLSLACLCTPTKILILQE